jgi:two-component sensor histidine kinase
MSPDAAADAAGQFGWLVCLREPALVVSTVGTVVWANPPARGVLGERVAPGASLGDHVAAQDELRDLLRRSSRSTAPLLGALTFAPGGVSTRLRTDCARIPGAGAVHLLLRLFLPTEEPIALLDRQVRHLNAQLRTRTEENLALQRALDDKRVLVSELQHRVKNNIQMMVSLLALTGKDAQTTSDVAALLQAARGRLGAMASTQEAIYRAEATDHVSADVVLGELVRSVGEAFGVPDRITTRLQPATLLSDNAYALALIANELLTNALKYGLRPDGPPVSVEFTSSGNACTLVVRDHGPGVSEEGRGTASGLRLVSGLCRQLKASLDVASENGTTCTLRFSAAGR